MQEQAGSAHYVDVELDRQDLDGGDCAAFENGAAFITLRPCFAPSSWIHASAPRCTEVPR